MTGYATARRRGAARSLAGVLAAVAALVVALLAAQPALAAVPGPDDAAAAEGMTLTLTGGEGAGIATVVQVFILMTALALLPSLLMMVTGFTRIIIVLGFIRNAMGTPTMPPNQVLIGIAVFLTAFVMYPTFQQVNSMALQPMMDGEITQEQALENAQGPIREFMFAQTRTEDLALFVRLADMERPETRADVPTMVLIPAFMVSELKTAFEIGFLIFVPFLIIDIVVASTLMSMGMIMLPPVMISLPFKVLLFVLVDGWSLAIESLVRGFQM